MIHHLGNSQSERTVWLCEELETPYELVRYEREATMAAPAAYKALHPAGTAPIITDGNVVLAESAAIVEYICRRHGAGRLILGPDHPDFDQYLFWFHYANGSMIPALSAEITATRLGGASPSDRCDIAYRIVEERLGLAPWFAGDAFTAADIMMVFPLMRVSTFLGEDLSNMPNLRGYLLRVAERPAFQTAMARAESKAPADPRSEG